MNGPAERGESLSKKRVNPSLTDKPRVLVIDDEVEVQDLLQRALSDQGFEVVTADSGARGLAHYAAAVFDVVLLDLSMPEMDGFEVLERLRAQDPDALIFIMTGYSSIESAVQAMNAGAVDYLPKPLNLYHLEIVLAKALQTRQQSRELRLLKEQIIHQSSFEGLVGVSPAMQRIYGSIRRLATSNTTVLIQGETGTGKELVARAIHARGDRREGKYMAVNSGALTETLLESELFGHEKGAFTGAIRQKYGLIEQAEGGTLFLDEIETMSPALQVKLLRAIQEREVLRIGGEQPLAVDFRLIAATNADLRGRMEQGAFRADLFYRLSVVVLDLPPLRERRGDIPLLATHFVTIHAEKSGRPVQEITPETLMILKTYGWPGNVRELENVIEQAVLFSDGTAITPGNLPPNLATSISVQEDMDFFNIPLPQAHERLERQYLQEMLDRTGGNVTEAARQAGISRQHFYQKMKRYNLSRG